jgi:hypothetical protein
MSGLFGKIYIIIYSFGDEMVNLVCTGCGSLCDDIQREIVEMLNFT